MSSSYSNTTYPPVRRRSGGTNPELDRALQDLLLNSLGITPTPTTTTTTPSMTSSATTSSFYWPPGLGTERSRPRSGSASDMHPLSQRLAEMIMEAFIDSDSGSGSGSSTTRPMGMGMGGRPAPPVAAPATPGMGTEWTNRPPLRSEYHEMMQLYHQNMMECNYTTQMIIDGLVASRTRSRNGIHEIYNTGGAYFATMREYHRTMEDSLRLYSDFYFGFNSYDDRNYTTPPRGQTTGAVPTAGRTTTTGAGTGTGTRAATAGATSTSPLPVVTRPHRFVRYTVFPYVTPTVEPHEQPLTETQIQEVTQEYVWSGTNEVGGGVGGAGDISGAAMATVCPITLDAFQPGEHISRIIHCGHEFKSSSLRRWFQRSSQCPLCRCNVLSPGVAPRRSRAPTMGEVVDISGVVTVTDLSGNTMTLVVPTPAPVPAPIPVVGPDSPPNQDDIDIVDRLHPLVEAFARQLDLQAALPSNIYHDHDHQTFHDMLMNSAEPPPRVTHPDENYPRLQGNLEGDNSIPDLEPILRALLQDHGSGPIESIDITYTVDYDVSGNG